MPEFQVQEGLDQAGLALELEGLDQVVLALELEGSDQAVLVQEQDLDRQAKEKESLINLVSKDYINKIIS